MIKRILGPLAFLCVSLVCCLTGARAETPGSEAEETELLRPGAPYCVVDPVLSTWEEARRYYFFHYTANYKPYWNIWYGLDSKSAPRIDDYADNKYIDLPLDRIKLIVLGFELPGVEEARLAQALYWRLGRKILVDRQTLRLVVVDSIPLVSGELRESIEADVEFQNALIERFLADGYTPDNIMRRLWDENVYLDLPPTFLRLIMGSSKCWPLTAMVKAAGMRVVQSDEYRAALNARTKGRYLDLGDSIDYRLFAEKLNMSEGMLYSALRGAFMHSVVVSVQTQQGKLRDTEPLPNVMRSAHIYDRVEQKNLFKYNICYADDFGINTWIGDSLDWQDLKPPVDPGDL